MGEKRKMSIVCFPLALNQGVHEPQTEPGIGQIPGDAPPCPRVRCTFLPAREGRPRPLSGYLGYSIQSGLLSQLLENTCSDFKT